MSDQLEQAKAELLNTPELHNFSEGVTLEALHQRQRWGSEHDAGKAPADWFWLVGYLAGKALHAQTSGNTDKALHHTISTAAALANWHASITGEHTAMRPGIEPTEPVDPELTPEGFAARLNRFMTIGNLTAKDVSELTGVSETTLSRLKNHGRMPDALSYAALCNMMGWHPYLKRKRSIVRAASSIGGELT